MCASCGHPLSMHGTAGLPGTLCRADEGDCICPFYVSPTPEEAEAARYDSNGDLW